MLGRLERAQRRIGLIECHEIARALELDHGFGRERVACRLQGL